MTADRASGCPAGRTAMKRSENRGSTVRPSMGPPSRRKPTSSVPRSSPWTTCEVKLSWRVSCTLGKARRYFRKTSGSEVSMPDPMKPTRRTPCSPRPTLLTSSTSSSMVVNVRRALSSRTSPALVRRTAREVRWKRAWPSMFSSLRICCESGGCARWSRWAARPKCSSSATAMK